MKYIYSKWRARFRLLVIALCAACLPAIGDGATKPAPPTREPRGKWPTDTFEFVAVGKYDLIGKMPDAPGLQNWGHISLKKNSVIDLDFTVAPQTPPQLKKTLWEDATFSYHGMDSGFIVPVLGAVCSVASIGGNSGGEISFKRITDPRLLKEFDVDHVDPTSIAISMGNGVGFNFYRSSHRDTIGINIKTITAGSSKEKPTVAMATVQTFGSDYPPRRPKEMEIRVGDRVPLMSGCYVRVTKIVVPDGKHLVVGWVEFSAKPEEAKK